MNESIYLVDREDFLAFTERLYAEKIRTEKVEDRNFTTVKVYGIDSLDCICAHRWFNDDETPDQYYIFNYPKKDEWGPAVPKRKVQLTKEETEIFFEELAKILRGKEKK